MTQKRWWAGMTALILTLGLCAAVAAEKPKPPKSRAADCCRQAKCCAEAKGCAGANCCTKAGGSCCAQGKCCAKAAEAGCCAECCSGSACCGGKAAKVNELLNQFNRLYREGRYAEAEKCARAAWEMSPDDPVSQAATHLAACAAAQVRYVHVPPPYFPPMPYPLVGNPPYPVTKEAGGEEHNYVLEARMVEVRPGKEDRVTALPRVTFPEGQCCHVNVQNGIASSAVMQMAMAEDQELGHSLRAQVIGRWKNHACLHITLQKNEVVKEGMKGFVILGRSLHAVQEVRLGKKAKVQLTRTTKKGKAHGWLEVVLTEAPKDAAVPPPPSVRAPDAPRPITPSDWAAATSWMPIPVPPPLPMAAPLPAPMAPPMMPTASCAPCGPAPCAVAEMLPPPQPCAPCAATCSSCAAGEPAKCATATGVTPVSCVARECACAADSVVYRAVQVDGEWALEVRTPRDTLRCKQVTLKGKGHMPLTISAGRDQVQIETPRFEGTADRLTVTGTACEAILEGQAQFVKTLPCGRDYRGPKSIQILHGQKIILDLADGVHVVGPARIEN